MHTPQGLQRPGSKLVCALMCEYVRMCVCVPGCQHKKRKYTGTVNELGSTQTDSQRKNRNLQDGEIKNTHKGDILLEIV